MFSHIVERTYCSDKQQSTLQLQRIHQMHHQLKHLQRKGRCGYIIINELVSNITHGYNNAAKAITA